MALPPITLPSGVPNFVADSQQVDERDVYAGVERGSGAGRKRRLFTVSDRRVKVYSKPLTQAQMAALDDWYENALRAGQNSFSVLLSNQGPGELWWEAMWAAPYEANPSNGRWVVTGELVLFGTGSNTGPVLGRLAAEILVALLAAASIVSSAPLASEISIALEPGSALRSEISIPLLATLTPLASEISIPLLAAGEIDDGTGALFAVDVGITDAGGYFTGTDVEAALQEVGAALAAAGGGGASGLVMAASSTTTDSDPGTGVVRWNNATQASATILYVDNATTDSTSIAAIWPNLTTGSRITITQADDPDTWQRWRLTSVPIDGTGYFKLPVTLEAQEGTSIANTESILVDIDAANSLGGQRVSFAVAASSPTAPVATGALQGRLRVYEDLTDIRVFADLKTAQASGSIFTVDINKNGSTILSTKLTIDNTEKTSLTAAVAAVLTSTTAAAGDEFTIDVDQVGDGTAVWLQVWLDGRRDDSSGGADGLDGADGKNLLHGASAPTSGDGVNGEYWINDTTKVLFGPKAGGSWPGGVSMVGVQRTVLASDVTNNNASANTIADVTALSFAVVSGSTYKFRFVIRYTAAATTTGSRWSVNGPATTFLTYRAEYSLTTTTRTNIEGSITYGVPAASNASSAATGGNIAIVEGIIKPSANGTVIARFASEVASSAIVAKAGSFVEFEAIA